jgi:DNA modification methylase
MGEFPDDAFDIHEENALNLHATLEDLFETTDGLVDAIITSPPYGDMQDYGDKEDQIGEQLYENFLDDLREVFKQCYDVASDESTLWMVTDTFRRNNRIVRPPFDIADELENLQNRQECTEAGCEGRLVKYRGTGELRCATCDTAVDPLVESWQLKDHIIWNKQRTRPWRKKGQLRNVYEHLSMYAKTDEYKYYADSIRIQDTDDFGRWWVNYPERYHPKGKLPDNIWEFPIPKQGKWGQTEQYHPSPFPVGLVERIIRLATDPGDIILDPFAGVGSTLAVAKCLDRKPIGFELNPDFIDDYHDMVLPEIQHQYQRQTIEQQTLFEDGATHNLEYLIWTLRIHKYAFQLQRELVKNDEIAVECKDIDSIVAITDPDTIGTESRPQTALYYVGTDHIETLNGQIDDAVENLISSAKGSGDYYEIDFNINACKMDDWLDSVARDVISTESSDSLYIYPEGVHHWYQDEVSYEKWRSMIENTQWKRYQTNTWVPLVSNLAIQVENPQDEVDLMEGEQTVLGNYDR